MSAQRGQYFDGACTIVDAHDALQAAAGNAAWFNEFFPVVESPKIRIAEVLLWLFYNLGLCCTIIAEFAMYIGGKLTSHPDLITIYIAYHPQKLCPEISALLQISTITVFSFDNLDFLYMPTYSRPVSNVVYTVLYSNEITALRLVIVNSVKPCGQRTSINFTYYMWNTFADYFTYYAMVVLPSRTTGDKI